MSLFGPPDVRKLRSKGNIRGLIKALSYKKSRWVRIEAAAALGKKGNDLAVEPLYNALMDTEEQVRTGAAGSLAAIGSPRAIELLHYCLGNDSEHVRMAAAAALSGIGDRSIVGILCQSLRSADEDIRRKASRSLVRVFDAEAVEPLCAALKDGSIDVREAAAEALGRIGDSRAVEPLCSVLEDEWIGVRIKALKALEGIADERAVGPLCEVIMDESGFHTVAVRTLGRIGDPRAVNALYLTWERCYQCSFNKNDIQSKEYEAEAREAAEAMSKMGRHFEERLLSALRAASLGLHVREGIADLLDSMGAVLNEEDKVWYMIARGSCNELISLGADAVGPLCTVLADSFTGRQAVEALVKIGADSVELLCGILKEKDFELKARAAEALIKLYREGNIEDRCKKKILSQKDIILTLHADISSECGYHEDKGVYRGDMEFLK